MGCKKHEGDPVLLRVADIFFPRCPDLPIPVTMIFFDLEKSISMASIKFASNLSDARSIDLASF